MLIYLLLLETEQDRETFAEIYEQYKNICLYVVMQITKNQDMAEDAVHNAFLEIIKRKDEFFTIPCSKRKSRIVIIAKNKAIDLMRKEGKSSPYGDDTEDFLMSDPDFTLKIESKESFERIVRVIETLPEKYRLTAILRYFHDMEYSKIAETLGITVNTVSVRLVRAKRMIAELLEKEVAANERE